MKLLNVERIKLFSTRSPYWCLVGILAASALFALLFGLIQSGQNATAYLATRGVGFGESVFMVLAALAVTTEYRFNTIKVAFLAAPNRLAVLLAKTVVLAVLGAVVGFVCGMGAFLLTKALAKQPPEPLVLQGEVWRETAGWSALFAVAAIIAVAVGAMIRQSAGAISIILIWTLIFEGLVAIIPKVGDHIQPWLPFQAGGAFVSPTASETFTTARGGQGNGFSLPSVPHPSPVGGLLVFLAYAVVLWLGAAILIRRRDA